MSSTPSYRTTIEYLFALQKQGVKLALANSASLMRLMGDPHLSFRSVHVAGTNGKGSTSAFIAGMMRAAGYRVGLYTSPHLVDFTERIQVNGVKISEAGVVDLAERVRKAYQPGAVTDGPAALNPTFFEVTTAMAFTYFAEEKVDICVVEVGMGGRLDSTNVITPLVSVITNIDLEHTEFLGTTLSQIAGEKAGIIKHGIPVVTGVEQPEAFSVIERTATEKSAALYRLGRDFRPGTVTPGRTQVFDYRGMTSAYDGISIHMLGRYQVDNACLALAAVECLRTAGIMIDERAMRSGLEQTRWEGRLERVSQGPDIYLDGAHNPSSARRLAAALRDMKPAYQRTILVLGILGDKDFKGIIQELAPVADVVVVTRPDYARAMDVLSLAAEVRRLHPSVQTAVSVEEAISCSRGLAKAEDLIVVTGSLYTVGDAKALFDGRTGAFAVLKG